MSVLIKNARIIDGSGKPGYIGSIYTLGERIEKIITEQEDVRVYEAEAQKVIDATGLVAAPGFIDTHSHSDLKVLVEPELLPKLMQGITTEILGQDGISMAPLPKMFIEPWRKNLAGLEGESDAIDWTYENTEQYLKMIEAAKPSINETYLLPHGNIRMEAMGLSNRQPTKEEIEKMREITKREMEAGCIGVSSGLIYMPCAYAQTDEIIEICKIVKAYGGIFVVHQRSEADDILASMVEILRIGRASGVKIHFSHFKVCGKNNWDKLEEMFDILDGAVAEGMTISLDAYPYVAGSTMLGVILPPWVHDGGTDQLVERLKDGEQRKRMLQDIETGLPGWDNFIDFVGVEGIYITSVASEINKNAIGLSLKELGEIKGKLALEAAFDLLEEEKNGVGMVDFYGTEDHVVRIMQRKEMNVCTDGLLSGKPHPRVYGSFPRILGKYVREEKVLTLEEAIYKMTYKPAKTFGIIDRGRIKEGYFADLTLFNPETVIDQGDFINPDQAPIGIEYVLVNGQLSLEKGIPLKERSGKVLRGSRKKV